MPSYSVFVPGLPKGQPRARSMGFTSKQTGKPTSRVYTPGTADGWRADVRAAVAKVLADAGQDEPDARPYRVDVTCFMPRPKSHFRANGSLKPNAPAWHTSKPDRDNLDKLILDAMTSVGCWHDDAQVVTGGVHKPYVNTGQPPGCRIKWESLEACATRLT